LTSIKGLHSQKYANKYKAGEEPGLLGKIRGKCLRFLKSSKDYNEAAMILLIKDTILYEELMLLYEKAGRHQQALMVVVEKIKNYSRAERYCLDHSDHDSDLFLTLFSIYLNSSSLPSSLPKSASSLLNNYPHFLDPIKVLPLLPENLPLHQILNYLTKSIQHNYHASREAMLVKNLNKLENLNVSARILTLMTNFVVVDRETFCKVCERRIGDRYFVRYPNGMIVHHKCVKDLQRCPVTGHDFAI